MFLQLSKACPMLGGSHSTTGKLLTPLCTFGVEILLMGFTRDKVCLAIKHFWMNLDAQPSSCSVRKTGCSMLLGEAGQTGLTCALLLKRGIIWCWSCGFCLFSFFVCVVVFSSFLRCPMGNQIGTLQRKADRVTLISHLLLKRLLSGCSEIFRFPSGIELLFSLRTEAPSQAFFCLHHCDF